MFYVPKKIEENYEICVPNVSKIFQILPKFPKIYADKTHWNDSVTE